VDVRLFGITLLTPAFLLAEPAQVSGEAGAYIHAADEAQLSPIVLQTISDIPVDYLDSASFHLSLIAYRRERVPIT
jgi:hypothetical protein